MEKINVSDIDKERLWKFGKNRITVNTDKEDIIISVSRSYFITTIPICNIVEKLTDNAELSAIDTGGVFVLNYHNERKNLTIKEDKLYLIDLSDDSGISIELT